MASACPLTPTKAAVMGRSSSSWKCGWGTLGGMVGWGGEGGVVARRIISNEDDARNDIDQDK